MPYTQAANAFKDTRTTPFRMIPLPKRLPKEIMDATADSMRSAGIYYWANEINARNGKAMIIGPADTPYAWCPLVFTIDCPTDYPFSSPAVSFMTSDGMTRFHPNLYVNGKVCLSILGTWSGPKWTAVMTLSTVLSSIQSILEKNPIVNEPGWEKYTLEHEPAAAYAAIVEFRLAALTFQNLMSWKKGEIPSVWKDFEDVLEERGDELLEKICEIIRKRAAEGDKNFGKMPYRDNPTTTDWCGLLKEVVKLGGA
jgi:ubiquitin-protein ligase